LLCKMVSESDSDSLKVFCCVDGNEEVEVFGESRSPRAPSYAAKDRREEILLGALLVCVCVALTCRCIPDSLVFVLDMSLLREFRFVWDSIKRSRAS
jgi:hypothetical protein